MIKDILVLNNNTINDNSVDFGNGVVLVYDGDAFLGILSIDHSDEYLYNVTICSSYAGNFFDITTASKNNIFQAVLEQFPDAKFKYIEIDNISYYES